MRLSALLKNVKKWVFELLFNSKIADREEELYFGKKSNESN